MWCSFIHEHTIVLEDSERRIVEQRVVNSESCSDNICSIIFLLPITDQKYYVSISTTNIFGSSQIAKSQIGQCFRSRVVGFDCVRMCDDIATLEVMFHNKT